MKTLQMYYQCCLEVTKQKRYQDKWLTDETYHRAIKAQFPTLETLGFDRGMMNKAISTHGGTTTIDATDFESVCFLRSIYDIVSQMHSPCLRLELLQYILGLDNRYSVAHVARIIELAASCLSISAKEVHETLDYN
jgi:hypothetical protein